MPEWTERRRADLKCADCKHEFSGYALFTVHDVKESSEPTDVIFDHAVSSCPNCGSPRVGDPGDPLFTNSR